MDMEDIESPTIVPPPPPPLAEHPAPVQIPVDLPVAMEPAEVEPPPVHMEPVHPLDPAESQEEQVLVRL